MRSIFLIIFTLLSFSSLASTIHLGGIMTNECNKVSGFLRKISVGLSAKKIPLYFDGSCGVGGMGRNGNAYKETLTVDLKINGHLEESSPIELEPIKTLYWLDECSFEKSVMEVLNANLAESNVPLYFESRCQMIGPDYLRVMSINLHINGMLNP